MAESDVRATLSRVLTWVLALVLVASLVMVVYVAANPPETGDPYTEFYILGPEGNASGYPTNLTVGETGEFIVGISNHEQQELTYTVALRVDNRTLETRTVSVGDGETWEESMSFTPESAGEKRLRILLYRSESAGGTAEAYRSLRLFVNVSEA
jgi:uncharacterized membrane protein